MLLCGGGVGGLGERWCFETILFRTGYLPRGTPVREDEVLTTGFRLKSVGTFPLLASAPTPDISIGAPVPLSPKPVKNREGTSTFVVVMNQQQKFRLQNN